MSSRATKSGAGRGGRITGDSGRATNRRDTAERRTSPRNSRTAGTSTAGPDTPNTGRRTGSPPPDPDRSTTAEQATTADQLTTADRYAAPAPATVAGKIRDAVLAVPGVTGLTPGPGVEVATLFPGGKIVGIRLGDAVEVHVEVGPVPIAPVAEQIRVAVHGVLAGFGQRPPVEVVVDDIDLPVPAGPADGS